MILPLLYAIVAIFVYEVTPATPLQAAIWPVYLLTRKLK